MESKRDGYALDFYGPESGVLKGRTLMFETFNDGSLFVRETRPGEEDPHSWHFDHDEARALHAFLSEMIGGRS